MNNYLTLLKKRAQRAYLRARIVAVRPDLIGKPFIVQVRTYAHKAIEAHAEAYKETDSAAIEPQFPKLVYEAMEVEADQSGGYYRTQAELYKKLYWDCFIDKALETADHGLAIHEANGLREVAATAIRQLEAIKFSPNRNN